LIGNASGDGRSDWANTESTDWAEASSVTRES
jgi:hypothetical protein